MFNLENPDTEVRGGSRLAAQSHRPGRLRKRGHGRDATPDAFFQRPRVGDEELVEEFLLGVSTPGAFRLNTGYQAVVPQTGVWGWGGSDQPPRATSSS